MTTRLPGSKRQPDQRASAAMIREAGSTFIRTTDSTPERAFANQIWWLKHIPLPQREFRFLEGRRFRFDFAWPSQLVAVEVEGGHWIGGHTGKRFEQDCEKYNLATIAGWRVIRVTPEQITSGEAVAWLEQVLLPF